MRYLIDQFINGQHVHSKESQCQPIYNPAIGEVIGQVAFATSENIAQAILAAKQAFPGWAAIPPLKRARTLFKFKKLLEQHTDELAALVTQENGKTLEDARGSVARGIELIEFFCGIPNLLIGSYSSQVGEHIDSYTIRQPLGISVGVTPFNFPVMVPIWLAIPAIACGNTFILKPSEKDPAPSLKLAELLQQAGLPDGVFNVLQGDKAVVNELITHPEVRTVSCVGSTPVAESIYQTAIAHGKRAHTFGGAKNHCVVMPDADLDVAAAAIASAAYGSAGERCMAISAVVAVTDEVADTLVQKIATILKTLVIAPGDNPKSQMGPLISQEHLSRVKQYIDIGIKEGAELVMDGRDFHLPSNPQGYFLGPNLFDRVSSEMRIYREEIFGPVLVVLRVQDFAEAINLVNQHTYGNGTAIFTKDGGVAHQFANSVQVGMVGINVPIPVPVAYHSFGGWKRSQFGDLQLHANESVAFNTQVKTITQRWPDAPSSASYTMPQH